MRCNRSRVHDFDVTLRWNFLEFFGFDRHAEQGSWSSAIWEFAERNVRMLRRSELAQPIGRIFRL
jgi:hypothetical protein